MELGQGAERLARELPRETRSLLGAHVHSAGELDLLLLLYRDRTRAWGLDEIRDALRCPGGWAEHRLAAMREAGLLIERDGRHSCAPATQELDEALQALDHAQRTRWAELTELIASPRRRRRALVDGGIERGESRG